MQVRIKLGAKELTPAFSIDGLTSRKSRTVDAYRRLDIGFSKDHVLSVTREMGTFYLIAPYIEGIRTKRSSFFNETHVNTVQPPSQRASSQSPFNTILTSLPFCSSSPPGPVHHVAAKRKVAHMLGEQAAAHTQGVMLPGSRVLPDSNGAVT